MYPIVLGLCGLTAATVNPIDQTLEKEHIPVIKELKGFHILHIHPGGKHQLGTTPKKALKEEGLL